MTSDSVGKTSKKGRTVITYIIMTVNVDIAFSDLVSFYTQRKQYKYIVLCMYNPALLSHLILNFSYINSLWTLQMCFFRKTTSLIITDSNYKQERIQSFYCVRYFRRDFCLEETMKITNHLHIRDQEAKIYKNKWFLLNCTNIDFFNVFFNHRFDQKLVT